MEQDKDTWSIPANLRWLAEQSDRPGYVPCGELTGRFLNLTADRFEALATRTNDQAKDEEIAELVEAFEKLRKAAAMLQQHAAGCAMMHYGEDFEAHGLPGWLNDTADDIDAAAKTLARFGASNA